MLTLHRVDHGSQQVELRLAAAMRDPDRILPLFARGVTEVDAGFGIDRIRLEATVVEPLPIRQVNPEETPHPDRLQELITRIGTRNGLENIQRFLPADSHIPERSFLIAPAAFSEAQSGFHTQRPRPLRLFPPEPIQASGPTPPARFRWRGMRLHTGCATGPERIAPEWWLADENWRSGIRRLLEGRDARRPPPVAFPHPAMPRLVRAGRIRVTGTLPPNAPCKPAPGDGGSPPAYAELCVNLELYLPDRRIAPRRAGLARRRTGASRHRHHRPQYACRRGAGLFRPEEPAQGGRGGRCPSAPAIGSIPVHASKVGTPENLLCPAGAVLPRLIVGARLVLRDCPVEWVALPTDRAAYHRLSRLLTLGKRRAGKAECHLDLSDLEAGCQGMILIALPPRALSDAVAPVQRLVRRYPGNVFLGAAPRYDGSDQAWFDACAGLALRTSAPMVAVGDVLMHRASRRQLADVLTCMREGITIDRIGTRALPNGERRLKGGGRHGAPLPPSPGRVAAHAGDRGAMQFRPVGPQL